MHKINSAVDERACNADVVRLDPVSPVRAPGHRNDSQVAGLPYVSHPAAQLIGSSIVEGGHEMYAGTILGGCPVVRDYARGTTKGKGQRPSTGPLDRNAGSRPSLEKRQPDADGPKPRRGEDIKSFHQAAAPEVEYMVVGQHTHVRPNGGHRLDVCR